MALVLRTVKGTELEWEELDGNFVWLQNQIEDLEGQTGSEFIVRVTPQEFLPAQMNQALANIGGAPLTALESLEERVELVEAFTPISYTPQVLTTEEKEVFYENVDVYSKTQVDNLIDSGVQPKQKQLFIHEITELDLTDPMRINLQLATIPDQDEWFDLHINGGFVSDNSYEITEDTLSIVKSEISEVSIGDKVIFRYREL